MPTLSVLTPPGGGLSAKANGHGSYRVFKELPAANSVVAIEVSLPFNLDVEKLA